jgi:hypothetical protein
VRSERALQGSRIRKGRVFIQLTSSGGGENRPIGDVPKRGNYDLLAHRGTDVERFMTLSSFRHPGWRGRARYKLAEEITRGQR